MRANSSAASGDAASKIRTVISTGFANAPANAYGQEPFLAPGDYDTPNEAYFRHADWVLRRAADKGFLVLLAPSYLGGHGPQAHRSAKHSSDPRAGTLAHPQVTTEGHE